MKNVQVIDDAINCTYDIFSVNDADFLIIFPNGKDIEFEPDLFRRVGVAKTKKILTKLWANRADKKSVSGIHGTLFFGEDCCARKKPFYPTKKDSEMIANPP